MNDSFSASSFLPPDQMLGGFAIFELCPNLGNVHIENLEQNQTEYVFVRVEGNNILP